MLKMGCDCPPGRAPQPARSGVLHRRRSRPGVLVCRDERPVAQGGGRGGRGDAAIPDRISLFSLSVGRTAATNSLSQAFPAGSALLRPDGQEPGRKGNFNVLESLSAARGCRPRGPDAAGLRGETGPDRPASERQQHHERRRMKPFGTPEGGRPVREAAAVAGPGRRGTGPGQRIRADCRGAGS